MVLPILIPATECWAVPQTLSAAGASSIEIRRAFKPRRRLRLEDRLPRGRRFWPAHWSSCGSADAPKQWEWDTLKACELVATANLRRWSRELRCNGRQIYAIARSCDASLRVLVGLLDREAMAWMLQAMYWKGLSHPMSLTVPPLHPPTGVQRWLVASSQCAMLDDLATVWERFVQVMRAYRARALALSVLLLKREVQQGRVRLRPELLRDEFWKN